MLLRTAAGPAWRRAPPALLFPACLCEDSLPERGLGHCCRMCLLCLLCQHGCKRSSKARPTPNPTGCNSADSEEDDPELLLHVPFDGAVKLTGITVVGGPEGAAPAKLKVSRSRRRYGCGPLDAPRAIEPCTRQPGVLHFSAAPALTKDYPWLDWCHLSA